MVLIVCEAGRFGEGVVHIGAVRGMGAGGGRFIAQRVVRIIGHGRGGAGGRRRFGELGQEAITVPRIGADVTIGVCTTGQVAELVGGEIAGVAVGVGCAVFDRRGEHGVGGRVLVRRAVAVVLFAGVALARTAWQRVAAECSVGIYAAHQKRPPFAQIKRPTTWKEKVV